MVRDSAEILISSGLAAAGIFTTSSDRDLSTTIVVQNLDVRETQQSETLMEYLHMQGTSTLTWMVGAEAPLSILSERMHVVISHSPHNISSEDQGISLAMIVDWPGMQQTCLYYQY